MDILDKKALSDCINRFRITQIYHLAAILSATGEKNPALAWQINMNGLLNVLEVSAAQNIRKIFFPSTIAVFGPATQKENTPQTTIMDPNTVYGISKLSGEMMV